MRHLYCALCLFCTVVGAVLPAAAQTQVETFNATVQYVIMIPGTIVGPDIDFDGNMIITTLDFTPGSVTFMGQPVDFDGTEASWLANTYDGVATLPALPGAPVPATGGATTTGPAGTMNADLNKNDVKLGPGFSDSNFDLVVPSDFEADDGTFSWNSGVVPELNGETVRILTQNSVVGVIPNMYYGGPGGTAIIDVVVVGEIIAFEPVSTEPKTWSAIKALYR